MASIEDLEQRVARLEEVVLHQVPAKVDAVAFGVATLHAEVQEVRRVQDEHTGMLGDIREVLRSHDGALVTQGELLRTHTGILRSHDMKLDQFGEMLAEILRRLPKPQE